MNIQIGHVLPDFKAKDENGNEVNNQTLKGKKVILSFYAQDDTPSCTKQVCSLKDSVEYFKSKGYLIYGISPDSEKKHQKFKAKYEIPFPLLADTDKSMLLTFGLFGPKKFMGKDVIGVYRTSVVIDGKGIVTHIIEKVNTGNHGEQLTEVLGLN
ncbi:MAG: peroxiredoxin [Saprospiraceae bacterium]|nr:peroxiredoxin [Saprospiraceae bacterium]